MDAANMLKPMLARGELRCIGATTIVRALWFATRAAPLDVMLTASGTCASRWFYSGELADCM